jgi:hypothetical protein
VSDLPEKVPHNRETRSILDLVQDRVQDANANGTTGDESAKAGSSRSTQPRGKSGRFERSDKAPATPKAEIDLSPTTLLTRLEEQSGQLGILRSKLEETRKALSREREAAQAARSGLEEERRARATLEAALKRERAARQQAEETAGEVRATASALEAQHHLMRAKLTTLEHKTGRRRLLRRGR